MSRGLELQPAAGALLASSRWKKKKKKKAQRCLGRSTKHLQPQAR